MAADESRIRHRLFWLSLIIIAAPIAALPYLPWLAGGSIPKVQAFAGWLLLIPLAGFFTGLATRKLWPTLILAAVLVFGAMPQLQLPNAAVEAHTEVRVLTFNAHRAEASPVPLARLIDAEDPDLLVLVETSEPLHRALENLDALNDYSYRTATVPAGGARDTVIFSKYAMTELDQGLNSQNTGWLNMPTVEIEINDQQILVAAVHVFPPLADSKRWGQGLDAIGDWARAHPDGPMIMAGDFNATRAHARYREAATGFSEATGILPNRTWPRTDLPMALIEIDHILGRGMTFTETRTASIEGSDHLAVHSTAVF
ncbi:endonuclease/exonuclease/phosphatase family protein [Glutamicibacter arilaitensis]|uniref:endonuclease/exonuclease/phosphatase family protein n=1 Tax=Glutamicibacter arilaitensis TaxID=256701 RepID=UPI00384D3176